MRWGSSALLVLSFFVVGCGSNKLVLLPPGSDQPVVQILPKGYGRLCSWVTFEQTPSGTVKVDYVLAQDGTSDWSVSRLFAFVSDIVGSLPIIGGNGVRSGNAMETPSTIQACAQLVQGATAPVVAP